MGIGDAAADVGEALGTARLPVAEYLLAKKILGIAEEKASEGMALEETVGVIVKASDLLSRSNAMVNGLKPWSRAPIAKRPPAARTTAGGKKKPCKIA